MSRIEAFWMPAMPAARLGLLRIAVAIYFLQDFYRTRPGVMRIGRTDPSLFEPVGLATLLDGPLPPTTFDLLHDTAMGLCLLMLFGVGWRVLGPLTLIVNLFVGCYRVSWGMVYHLGQLPMLHLMVLGLAPATAGVSLDAWARRRWPQSRLLSVLGWQPDGTGSSWHYGWPIQLICVITTLAYFLAGWAKVHGPAGWAWADGKNLLDQVAYDGLYKDLLDKEPASAMIAWSWQHAEVFTLFAVGTLILELGAPIALLHRRVGQLWSVGTVGMHWGIHLMMNLVFPYPISGAAFLSFFPLEKLLPERWR